MDTPPGTKHILVVEDDLVIQRLLGVLLRAEGYRVSIACDGQEGLARARELRPDLVTLDLALPKLSGTELLSEMANSPELRHIPVVLISGYTDGLGPLGPLQWVVRKPFEVEHLVEVIRSALEDGE